MLPDVLPMQIIAELRKARDSASHRKQTLQDIFEPHSLVISLFTGFTAGALVLPAAGGFSAGLDGEPPHGNPVWHQHANGNYFLSGGAQP
ncbi:MAG: hypothetical protein KGJ19_10305 [Betaproteobacteria bacterium]|nr:hypothetical protein [Betaproteobacteria bacterium]